MDLTEVEENEHNLNIPRYVDTFEPEEPIDVNQALGELETAGRMEPGKALYRARKEELLKLIKASTAR